MESITTLVQKLTFSIMADEFVQDTVWNAYYVKHDNKEPRSAQELMQFSQDKNNNMTSLKYINARTTYTRNKGKGKIDIEAKQKINEEKQSNDDKTEEDKDIDYCSLQTESSSLYTFGNLKVINNQQTNKERIKSIKCINTPTSYNYNYNSPIIITDNDGNFWCNGTNQAR